MSRLIPIAEALGEDLDAAAANRARVVRLRARKSSRAGQSYIVGDAPSNGLSGRMSGEHRRLLKYSTRGMNNK